MLFCLFEACTRLGIEDPSTADFSPVAELIEQDWAGGKEVDSAVRSNIRRIYRTLREAGALSGPDWNGNVRRKGESLPLVGRADMKELAELYGAELEQPGLDPDEPWPEVFDRYSALVAGPYGLRALLTYATARSAPQ